MKNRRLSIVIPAYNEGDYIYNNLTEIDKQISSFSNDYELIIINDGSKDNTAQEIEKVIKENNRVKLINCPENKGKGYALKTGTEVATGELIAFCDADLDIAPKQLEYFIQEMDKNNASVVIGSKMHKDSKVEYPLIRKIYSLGYYVFLMMLFRLNVKDTQTGLKLFKADIIKPVMKRILVKRFAFDIEVLSIVNSLNEKIISVPIEIKFNRHSLGRIRVRDICNMLVDTLAVFYRLKIIKYYKIEEIKNVK